MTSASELFFELMGDLRRYQKVLEDRRTYAYRIVDSLDHPGDKAIVVHFKGQIELLDDIIPEIHDVVKRYS